MNVIKCISGQIVFWVVVSGAVLAQPNLPNNYTPPRGMLNLSELEGDKHGFALLGEVANSYTGTQISSGDINGDGYDDIIINATGVSPNESVDGGRIYVVFGKKNGFPNETELSSLDGSNGFMINGGTDEFIGSRVVTGDINADGFDEIIFTSQLESNGSGSSTVYVMFGKKSSFSSEITTESLNSSKGFKIKGAAGQNITSALSTGDLNGDGYAEILIGSESADANGTENGKVYTIFGKAGSFGSIFDLSNMSSSNGFSINGASSYDRIGSSLSSGDVNGDGFEDVIIAQGSYAHVFIVFGKLEGYGTEIEIEESSVFTIIGEYLEKISSGDVNGDGYDDIIIGSRLTGPSGKTQIVFGSSDNSGGEISLLNLNSTSGFIINGEELNSRSGYSVSSGDVNRDGYDDIILGANAANSNGTSYVGKTYIVFGKSSEFDSEVELSDINGVTGISLSGEAYGDQSGAAVTTADVNGDGYADVLISSVFADPNGTTSGKVYVFTNTVEQKIYGAEGFRMLGGPASGKVFDNLLGQFWTQGFTNSDGSQFGLNTWTWNHSSQSWEGLSDQLTDNLDAGQGFLHYMFSDNNNNGEDEGFPKTISSPTSFVSVDNFDYLVNTSVVRIFDDLDDGGFYLASNPYPYTINWDAESGWDKKYLNNTIHIWSDGDKQWLTWNGNTGTLMDMGRLSAFQGFFVQAEGGTGVLSLTDEVVIDQYVPLKKESYSNPKKEIQITLKANEYSSSTIVSFHPEGKSGKDRLDGVLMAPLSQEYVQVGTINPTNNDAFSINTLPDKEDQYVELPLYLKGETGFPKAKLFVSGIDDLGSDWKIILRDTDLNQDVELTEESIIEIEMDVTQKKGNSSTLLAKKATMLIKTSAEKQRYSIILKSGKLRDAETFVLPETIELSQNYPNPFNPSTSISYQIPADATVTLEIFDIVGRQIETLISNELRKAGSYTHSFNASSLSSGVYIYRLKVGEMVYTKYMTLLK